MTGVRFVKKDRVIHLEIEQAKALPEGMHSPTNAMIMQHYNTSSQV